MKKENNSLQSIPEFEISRKEAIRRIEKYAAFTAASMLLLMSQADSLAAQKSPGRPKRH